MAKETYVTGIALGNSDEVRIFLINVKYFIHIKNS